MSNTVFFKTEQSATEIMEALKYLKVFELHIDPGKLKVTKEVSHES